MEIATADAVLPGVPTGTPAGRAPSRRGRSGAGDDFVLSPDNKYCVYISVSTLFPSMDNDGNSVGGCISPTETFYYYYRLRDRSLSTEKIPFHFSSSMVPGKDKECICRMPVKDK